MKDLKEFRSELPFGDDVLSSIRRDVMEQIEREPRRQPMWMGIFFRATLAATALLVLILLPRRHDEAPDTTTIALQPHAPVAVTAPPPPPAPVLVAPTEVVPTVVRVASHRPPRRKPTRTHRTEHSVPTTSAESAAVRVELHTSNPNIRILWISNSSLSSGDTR